VVLAVVAAVIVLLAVLAFLNGGDVEGEIGETPTMEMRLKP
jgi:hypothetical protein